MRARGPRETALWVMFLMQINVSFFKRTMLSGMNTLEKNTLQSLKTRLLAREAQMLGEIDFGQKTEAAAISTNTREVNDQEDQAGMRERTTILNAEVRRDSNELIDVRAALVRLNEGSYGICIDCARPIDLQRLIATPSAARCMTCQEKFEAQANLA